jgi:hypothetical protein
MLGGGDYVHSVKQPEAGAENLLAVNAEDLIQ